MDKNYVLDDLQLHLLDFIRLIKKIFSVYVIYVSTRNFINKQPLQIFTGPRLVIK